MYVFVSIIMDLVFKFIRRAAGILRKIYISIFCTRCQYLYEEPQKFSERLILVCFVRDVKIVHARVEANRK